jgi:hypothetical protein
MACISAGAAAVIYFTKQDAKKHYEIDLGLSSEEISMKSEHILKRIMRADTVQHNCGTNSTPACCDKSCRSIKYQLVHNWEVIELCCHIFMMI